MLYTKKDIEKLIADLVAKFITEHGARVCMDDNNYSCSEHDIHINLLLDNDHKITIYKTRDQWDGLHVYDCGSCEIGYVECAPVKVGKRTYYPEANSYTHVIHSLYHYKDIYTDNQTHYELMKSKSDFRLHNKPSNNYNRTELNYNPDVVLRVLKRHKGYKRLKAKDIVRVDRVRRYAREQYIIYVVDKEPIRVYFKK